MGDRELTDYQRGVLRAESLRLHVQQTRHSTRKGCRAAILSMVDADFAEEAGVIFDKAWPPEDSL